MPKTGTGSAHRHWDKTKHWSDKTDVESGSLHTHDYVDIPHPADVLTAAEVTAIKLLIAGGGGGTTPIPNPPPGPTPDITAPVISGIAQVVTTTTATITWTTNEAATGLVQYGVTTAYGAQTASTSSGTAHSRTLSGLVPSTLYHYQVRATDTAGNLGLSGDRTFTTAAPASGVVAQFPGTGANTSAAFLALVANMSIDTIMIAAGTYTGWQGLQIDVDRTARPLLVRPAPGAAVVWQGPTGAVGLFYFGVASKCAFITFDPTGTGGSFTITGYALGSTGLIGTGWVEDLVLNRFIVRNTTVYPGTPAQNSHTLYVSSDGVHRAKRITANDWDVDNYPAQINGLHIFHTPQADGVTSMRWKHRGGYWGAIGRDAATGVLIDGWAIADTTTPVDFQVGVVGIVRNVHATNSGPPIIVAPMVDGGGNIWSSGGDITAPVPINITASAITQTTAEVSWSSVEAGNGQVEYGLTIGYGSLTTLEASYLTAHSQTLTSLVPNKLYHYRVRSADAAGNLGLSSDRTFTTLNTTPTPSPGRRFAAPTTTVTVAVPGGIDATGATDVRAALLSFIAGLANGTRITATSGARYKVSSGLRLTNRQHLVFDWTGVTLHNTGGGGAEDGCFYLDNCSDIALIGINYIGANPTPGRMSSAGEHSATVYVSDGLRIEMSGGSSKDVHGDGTVTINRDGQYVWVHDMTVTNCGRMAAAVVWGSHVWVERNTVGPCGFAIWDIEPESASNGQTMTDIHFLDNDAWGWSPQSDGTLWHGFFFGASAGVGSTAIVDNIHVERNRVTGPGSTQSTIQSYIGSQNTPFGRRTNGTFLDNTGQTGPIQQAQPGLVTFRHCDNWTYGRNGAAPTSGSLYGFVDSTGMTAV